MRVTTLLKKEKNGTLYKESYKLQGSTEVQGVPIAIENRKGSVRKGKNSDGTEWSTKFKAPYGYIKGTKGADGDEIDAYVGPDKDAPKVHVVHQHKDTGKGYDEDKVMIGFKSKGDAKKTFLQHYDDPKYLGPISTMTVEELKARAKKKGPLRKQSTAPMDEVSEKKEQLSKVLGLDVGGLGKQRILGTAFSKVKRELQDVFDKKSSAEDIFMQHMEAHPECYKEAGLTPVELAKRTRQAAKGATVMRQKVQALLAKKAAVGAVENKLPWYTTALGGTGGALLGQKLLKKKPVVGALLGTLAGTGIGLETGGALGRKIDTMRKKAGSSQPMHRTFGEGAARGLDSQVYNDPGHGKPALAKSKSGDAPMRDQVPEDQYPRVETMPGTNRSMDSAMKAAGAVMAQLVDQGDEFPTRADVGKQDPARESMRARSGYQHAGASQPSTEYNPDASAKTAHVITLEELDLVDALMKEAFLQLDASKLASVDVEELYKEALLGALRRALPGKRLVQMGDEVVDLAPEGAYKSVGKHLKSLGKGLKLKKGVTPEMAAAVGQKSTAGGRILGEGLEGAGQHMTHASTAGKVLNPLGKPAGGLVEGLTRGAGQELQRAAGAGAEVGAGGLAGSMGRKLVRHAPRIGQAGEIAGAAGTATLLGGAISPAAAGLAGIAKATGTYAPLKGALGGLGFNVAKDTAATALEQGGRYAPRVMRAAQAAGRGLAAAV